MDIQNALVPTVNPPTLARKRPARTPGLTGTSAAFLVPDHIRKKFADGWNVHIPLTYLTDRGCLMKDKPAVSSSQDILTIDNASGRILTTAKPLPDDGELELSFDEWHQAWRRLLELIRTFLPEEILMWESHYFYILNKENRAEMWPLYLAYDAEIRRRATQTGIDPSAFSLGIWNDLEARYTAKKVLYLVQSDLKQNTGQAFSSQQPSNQPRGSKSFRGQSRNSSFPDSNKSGRCIFCGDLSKDHMSRNCPNTSNTSGNPCFLSKHGPSGTRRCKSGKSYCYAWNGLNGCDHGSACRRGEHSCTLCGSKSHTAQKCDAVA